MKKYLPLLLFPLLNLSCINPSLEIITPDELLATRGEHYASYAGAAPVSGSPIKAYVESGIAPLSFEKSIAIHFIGYSYESGKEYPDLFFMHNTGSVVGTYTKVFSWSGKSKDGRLIYSSAKDVAACPWDAGDRRVKVMPLSGKTTAIFLTPGKISKVEYNMSSCTFGPSFTSTATLTGKSLSPDGFDFVVKDETTAIVYVLVGDGTAKQEKTTYPEQGYYNSTGQWLGHIGGSVLYSFEFDYKNWKQLTDPQPVTAENMMDMPNNMCCFNDVHGGVQGVLSFGKFGAINFCNVKTPSSVCHISDGNGNPRTYSGVPHRAVAIQKQNSLDATDFIVSGEGAPYLYHFTGKYDSNSAPIFSKEEYVLCSNADLYGGSLTVPTIVDWDCDGVLDIISGNSEGRIFFYRNYGSTASPAFGDPIYLQSCGEEVHFRGGYYEVQGPDDGGAWGYICPNVIDWNGDSIPDILTSSNATRVEVMLGTGASGADCLGPRQIITMDGLELWGMWRVRPGVAKIGNDIYIVFMDTDDALHLYKKTSNTTVCDCGKLQMSDGRAITGHYDARLNGASSLGYQGREKIEFCDWDGDGDYDLLVGGTADLCMPAPERGLPWNGNSNQIHAVYLENVGSNEKPVFAHPKQLLYKNNNTKMALGHHAQSPSACMLGTVIDDKPNLVLGCEGGKFWFFSHNDITFLSL